MGMPLTFRCLRTMPSMMDSITDWLKLVPYRFHDRQPRGGDFARPLSLARRGATASASIFC
eukprot:scaffold69243_cov65-Phaeocystis_antarctica.AAC.3